MQANTDALRIMIVEDEAVIGLVLADALKDEGHRIIGPFASEHEAPGLSHLDLCGLGEEGGKVGVVPPGALELALHGARGGLELREIEGKPAQQSQVLGAMILTGAQPILVHGHVQNPMQPVLDAPMRPHDGQKALGAKGRLIRK